MIIRRYILAATFFLAITLLSQVSANTITKINSLQLTITDNQSQLDMQVGLTNSTSGALLESYELQIPYVGVRITRAQINGANVNFQQNSNATGTIVKFDLVNRTIKSGQTVNLHLTALIPNLVRLSNIDKQIWLQPPQNVQLGKVSISYPLAWGQPLQSYPRPQIVEANGQIQLTWQSLTQNIVLSLPQHKSVQANLTGQHLAMAAPRDWDAQTVTWTKAINTTGGQLDDWGNLVINAKDDYAINLQIDTVSTAIATPSGLNLGYNSLVLNNKTPLTTAVAILNAVRKNWTPAAQYGWQITTSIDTQAIKNSASPLDYAIAICGLANHNGIPARLMYGWQYSPKLTSLNNGEAYVWCELQLPQGITIVDGYLSDLLNSEIVTTNYQGKVVGGYIAPSNLLDLIPTFNHTKLQFNEASQVAGTNSTSAQLLSVEAPALVDPDSTFTAKFIVSSNHTKPLTVKQIRMGTRNYDIAGLHSKPVILPMSQSELLFQNLVITEPVNKVALVLSNEQEVDINYLINLGHSSSSNLNLAIAAGLLIFLVVATMAVFTHQLLVKKNSQRFNSKN